MKKLLIVLLSFFFLVSLVSAASISEQLSSKSTTQKAIIKASEIVKNEPVLSMVSKTIDVSTVDQKEPIGIKIEKIWYDKNRVCVKYRAYDEKGEYAVINPTCIYNPPILVTTGYKKPDIKIPIEEQDLRILEEKPDQALLEVLRQNAINRKRGPAINDGNDPTEIIFAEYDGYLVNSKANETWGYIHDTTATTYVYLDATDSEIRTLVRAGGATDTWAQIRRTGLTFNFTNIYSNYTINSIKESLYFDGTKYTGTGIRFVTFTPQNKLSYSIYNYNTTNWGTSNLAPPIEYSDLGTIKYIDRTFTDTSWVNKGALSTHGLRVNYDADNSPPTWVINNYYYVYFWSVDKAGTTYDPYITVDYTLPDTTPPESITDLSGEVLNCFSINWTWTNPPDADYGNLMIYKNGVFLKNVTNTTTYDLWTGLTGNTPYTFSSQTCDLNYNCNQTWINSTVSTSVCPPFSVSFTSNTTCGSVPLDVQFNDTTTGTPLSWSWLFGDGNTSTSQNPIFRYNMTGLYTVNLSANNTVSSGSSNITGYIRVMESWGICPPTPTPSLPWTPDINPSTDTGVNPWQEWLVSMWWLWLLIVLFLILVKK